MTARIGDNSEHQSFKLPDTPAEQGDGRSTVAAATGTKAGNESFADMVRRNTENVNIHPLRIEDGVQVASAGDLKGVADGLAGKIGDALRGQPQVPKEGGDKPAATQAPELKYDEIDGARTRFDTALQNQKSYDEPETGKRHVQSAGAELGAMELSYAKQLRDSGKSSEAVSQEKQAIADLQKGGLLTEEALAGKTHEQQVAIAREAATAQQRRDLVRELNQKEPSEITDVDRARAGKISLAHSEALVDPNRPGVTPEDRAKSDKEREQALSFTRSILKNQPDSLAIFEKADPQQKLDYARQTLEWKSRQ